MSGKQSGKGAKGDDAVDVVSIAVLESKVEIPLVDSTATLLTQSEKQTAAEMEAPRVPDGEDVDGSRDRAVTGRAERSMKQDFNRIIQESKGQTNRLALGIFFLILTALCSMFIPYFAGKMTDAVTIALTGDPAHVLERELVGFEGVATEPGEVCDARDGQELGSNLVQEKPRCVAHQQNKGLNVPWCHF